MKSKKHLARPDLTRQLDIDLNALLSSRTELICSLRDRIERFCASAPLEELNVVFHSTGVNYAHQFYVLTLFGKERLSQLGSVHFVSGSAIAAIVFYSYHSGNLLYGAGYAKLWERLFFATHGLEPMKSILRLPVGMLRGAPVLSNQVQLNAIKKGIGEQFSNQTISIFPLRFHFWVYDTTRNELMSATADNHLSFIKLAELAVAATAVPHLLLPFEIADYRFVDPVFSRGRKTLQSRLHETTGPKLLSNMLFECEAGNTVLVRPHVYANGNLLMARELIKFCLGMPNVDHAAGLEIGLIKLHEDESQQAMRRRGWSLAGVSGDSLLNSTIAAQR